MSTVFDINKGCTIDSTGLNVTVPGSRVGTRGSTGYNVGKKYFEVECELKDAAYNIGLCDADNELDSSGWPSSASMFITVLSGSYRIVYGNSYLEYLFPQDIYINPGIVGVAIDFDNHEISYYYNGARLVSESYNGKISNIGTMLYPFTFSGGGADRGIRSVQTWNFGLTPFKYPVPVGYEPWDKSDDLPEEPPALDKDVTLLRVTMIDSSVRDYQLSDVEIDAFVKWYTQHKSTDDTAYSFAKKVGTQKSKEYLTFNKIISFEVIKY